MFSYRSILKQAWAIVWKHKYLWFFSLFASLAVAGGSMEYQFLAQTMDQGLIDSSYQNLSGILTIGDFFQQMGSGIVNLFNQNIVTILNAFTFLLLFLLLVFIFVWLAIVCQAALVDNVKKILSAKKKAPVFSIREGLTNGSRHFWSVLGLNILIKALICFAFFIASLPLLFLVGSDNYSFVIVYTILFTIFVPVAVSLSLIIKYAISDCVLEDDSMTTSIKNGWKLFKKNWLISLEVALILFFISFLASFILLLVIFILFFPIFWLSLAFSITWLSIVILLLGLIFIIAFGSILTSFQVATWTNLYLHLKENKGIAKLERIFKKK
jgi:hypothetical protein